MTSISRLSEKLHRVLLDELKDEVLDALDYDSIAMNVLERIEDSGYLREKARRIAEEMEEEITDEIVDLVKRELFSQMKLN